MISDLIKLITEYFEVDVHLPTDVLEDFQSEFLRSSSQQQGILAEILFSLWLRRVFEDKSSWVLDRYAPVDFKVHDHLIDVKFTNRPYYSLPDLERARTLARINGRTFDYILISIKEWNLSKGFVKLQIQEIISIEKNGDIKRCRPESSTKRFL